MKVLIDQPFGIGDILFLTPLVRKMEIEHAVWPVVDYYYWIRDYVTIPHVDFIKQSEYSKDQYADYNSIPFQHAHQIKSQARDCMEAKYNLFNLSVDHWSSISFNRNDKKELSLLTKLNINPQEDFIVVNNQFAGQEHGLKTDIQLETNMRVVEMQYLQNYTLLDWCGVLERAKEIHTVSTALFFVVEALNLEKKSLHLYPRKPIDKDLSPIRSLISTKWICHE